MKNNIGLYVHVPFCGRKCPYCDFYSIPFQAQTADSYVNAVCRDMRRYGDGEGTSDRFRFHADSLYFGGGTPSLLSPLQLQQIIDTAASVFELCITSPDCEITLEANPNAVTKKRLFGYRSAGVNRLSLGIQSLQNAELAALGRTHSAKTAREAVLTAFDAGFTNISADIMLGTPGQTLESLSATITELSSLPITHVSAYMLKIEENTPFYSLAQSTESGFLSSIPDDDKMADFFLKSATLLEENGFIQYEISNFAKDNRPEFMGRHNLKYWRCEEYLGFGASAHSFLNGKRFCNSNNAQEYIEATGKNPIITDENAGGADEWLMLGLRLSEGISLEKAKRLLPRYDSFEKKALTLCNEGLCKIDEGKNRLYLTKNGMLLSNSIIVMLTNL